jgi:hypothetical protein
MSGSSTKPSKRQRGPASKRSKPKFNQRVSQIEAFILKSLRPAVSRQKCLDETAVYCSFLFLALEIEEKSTLNNDTRSLAFATYE